MSELLILKETIYKDEVDMLMAGKTVKQIVKVMDALAIAIKTAISAASHNRCFFTK